MDIWFVAWDISDQDAALTGRVILSIPCWEKTKDIWWDNRKWVCVGGVQSSHPGRDWLVCEPR
jgi:hypothetical protein